MQHLVKLHPKENEGRIKCPRNSPRMNLGPMMEGGVLLSSILSVLINVPVLSTQQYHLTGQSVCCMVFCHVCVCVYVAEIEDNKVTCVIWAPRQQAASGAPKSAICKQVCVAVCPHWLRGHVGPDFCSIFSRMLNYERMAFLYGAGRDPVKGDPFFFFNLKIE